MNEANDDMARQIGSLGAKACVELFAAYGVTLHNTDHGWRESDVRLFSGVIGFTGRSVRGTCLLAGEESVLKQSCPEGGQLRDWVGELANQLAGRLKSKLLNRGAEVALTTPIALSGVRLMPLPRGRLEPTVLGASAGPIMVWIEVEVDSSFALGSENPVRPGVEGDLLLFE